MGGAPTLKRLSCSCCAGLSAPGSGPRNPPCSVAILSGSSRRRAKRPKRPRPPKSALCRARGVVGASSVGAAPRPSSNFGPLSARSASPEWGAHFPSWLYMEWALLDPTQPHIVFFLGSRGKLEKGFLS